eukprot:243303-Amphidinium_carterae.1
MSTLHGHRFKSAYINPQLCTRQAEQIHKLLMSWQRHVSGFFVPLHCWVLEHPSLLSQAFFFVPLHCLTYLFPLRRKTVGSEMG